MLSATMKPQPRYPYSRIDPFTLMEASRGADRQMDRRRFLALTALAAGALAIPVQAQERVSNCRLTLGTAAANAVPLDYLGFSCETVQLADPTFFAANNHELVSLFKSLAPRRHLAPGRQFQRVLLVEDKRNR